MLDAQARRLAELAEQAGDRAAEVARALDGLAAEVEEVRLALAEARRAGEAAAPPSVEQADAQASISLDSARLVALEMAGAGRSRAEVQRHLRTVYRGPDTEALLDDVFGEPRGASSL